ncbi:MAG: class I SAM-dependent methyltransferase [Chloroflexi bacterium]|nr:class I SAM-dependent methyltransferase [Chloroflexota bacterium]
MHQRRFHDDIARLRSPERLARLEVSRVVELITQGGNIRRVLDIGTGSGVFAEAFAHAGFEVEGLDANPEMLAAARDLVPGVLFQEGTAESPPYPDTAFDLVFMGLLFHETDDRLKALREAARMTRQRIAILEWPYENQDFGPGLDERLTEKDIKELAVQAGLTSSLIFHLQTLVLYFLEK